MAERRRVPYDPEGPRRRFYTRLERFVRVWVWLLGAAIVLALFGLVPTWITVAAHLGPVWVGIAALVLWGRWLDETMHWHSDMEDGPK